MLKINYM